MNHRSKNYLFWILPILLGIAAFLISRLDTAELLEMRLIDARFKMRGPISIEGTPFQVIVVDDQTFDALNRKWPFDGLLYAHLIDNLNRAGARLIVFDIEFTEQNRQHPEQDSLFAEAVKTAGNVILAGKIAYTYSDRLEESFAVQVPPIKILRETGVPWGLVNEINDPDDFTRRSLLFLSTGDSLKPSLDIEILRAMNGYPLSETMRFENQQCLFGDIAIPLYDEQSFLINYYGPAGTFPSISLSSALDDSTFDLDPSLDSDYMERFISGKQSIDEHNIQNPFKAKVILIGASAEELHDNKNTSFYSQDITPRRMPGVEVHAHALQTILDRSFITRIPPLAALIINILIIYVIFLLITLLKSFKGLLASGVSIAIGLLVIFFAFSHWNLWVDMASPLIAIVLAYPSVAIYNYFQERREKACIRGMFSHYVPERVVKEIIAKPELLHLGGEKRRLTVMFSDIEGFTHLSDSLSPEKLVIMLNEYMTDMTEIIQREGGIIDKYEGDLIMAEFGAPVPSTDHAEGACRAALKMQGLYRTKNGQLRDEDGRKLKTRIGINTGEVIVGNMGSKALFDYTVLGDAVNVCSRLEYANKLFKTGIIISEECKKELPDHYVTRLLGNLTIKGRGKAVRIYELIAEGAEELTAEKLDMLARYSDGWSYLQDEKWEEAITCFEEALKLIPGDEPSRLCLERIERNRADWDGSFSLDEL